MCKCSGITKRDLYAGFALLGLVQEAVITARKEIDWQALCVGAHQVADVMVESELKGSTIN
jgi:hypothetical protein